MELFIAVGLLIVGLVVIIKGGDWFVDAAVWVATVSGISPIMIGATIVSLATTLPELFVSTTATLQGAPDIAIGNALGSTICNLGLIMAISILFNPGALDKKVLYTKATLMIGSTAVLYLLTRDRVLLPYEGIILLSLLGVYVVMNFMEANRNKKVQLEQVEETAATREKPDKKTVISNIMKFAAGITMIVIGSRLLVDNAILIAEYLNVPQQIIGVTIIALGTSLPEFTTAIAAIVKGHTGISVGNIIGANILNVTMILGTSALLSKEGLTINTRNIEFLGNIYRNVPQTLSIDLPVSLLIMGVFILPCLFAGTMKRIHGGGLLTIYLLYIGFLVSTSM